MRRALALLAVAVVSSSTIASATGNRSSSRPVTLPPARPGVMPTAPAVTPRILTPSGTTRGRVYLFHGLDTDYSQFLAAPFDSLTAGLVSDQWQVVEVGEVYDGATQSSQTQTDFTTDTGHGLRLRNAIIALHQQTVAWVNYNYGLPAGGHDALFGVSWGAMMVELLAQDTADFTLRAAAMHLPATNPSVMTEFSGDNVSGLQPTPAWGAEPGWISYGLMDTRVGFTDTQALANTLHGINSAVQVVSYNQGHTTTAGNVTDILAFFAAVP